LSSRRPTSRLNGLGTDSTATRGGILVYNGSSASIRNTSLSGNMQANVWLFMASDVDIRASTLSAPVAPSAGAFVTNLQAQIQGVVRIGTGTIIETSPADGVSLFSGASFEVRNDTPSTIRNNIGFAHLRWWRGELRIYGRKLALRRQQRRRWRRGHQPRLLRVLGGI